SDDAAPIPAEPGGEDHAPSTLDEMERAASVGRLEGPDGSSGLSADDGEISPHSKPFRAWGAAQEERDRGTSLWGRFRAWVAGLFRKKAFHDAQLSDVESEMSSVDRGDDVEMESDGDIVAPVVEMMS